MNNLAVALMSSDVNGHLVLPNCGHRFCRVAGGNLTSAMTTGISPPQPLPAVRAELLLQQSNQGGSGSFLVRANDRRRYWCKVLNNTQGVPLVPVNEQIVGRLGALIGVAVCEVRLVEIPQTLAGWEFRPGHTLQPGIAHGSAAVEGAVETRELEHRAEADNAARHAGFYALHDWLGGSDPQWLRATADGNRYYSHDHGHYVFGPAWTPEILAQRVADPAPLGKPSHGLSVAEIDRVAKRLETMSEEEISGALSNLPDTWPIGDASFAAVVNFATQRCDSVAQRLRALPV
jgi:hypothetical protein